MTGTQILAATAVVTTSSLLLASAVANLTRRDGLRADLAAHRILRWPATAARALPVAELVAGSTALVALTGGHQVLLVAALATQAGIFAASAGYLGLVARAGRAGLPCGCGLPAVPVGPGAIGRAAALALLAGAGALRAAVAAPPPTAALGDLAVVTTAGATLALLVAIVQPARRHPAARPTVVTDVPTVVTDVPTGAAP
ncbi:MAG TPA: MauE/DoxX family redox-associated membrane protein [Kineosporiaceae bacterium]|nr:MauE/DoxX family redox-associated membrane protein [Kineosporiaceae bacterium]